MLSKRTLESFLRRNGSLLYSVLPGNETNVVSWSENTIFNKNNDDPYSGYDYSQGLANITEYTISDGPNVNLPAIIKGWQYLGQSQYPKIEPNDTTIAKFPELVWLKNTKEKPSQPYYRIPATPFLRSSFHLNLTVAEALRVVPYNSTIWFSNTSISLQAPFLQLKDW